MILRLVYGAGLLFAGVGHFRNEKGFVSIMPSFIPFKRFFVQVTGIIEMAYGLMLLTGKGVHLVRKTLPAFLFAVLPANVNMAVNPKPVNGKRLPSWLLWTRLPLQWGLVALAKRLK